MTNSWDPKPAHGRRRLPRILAAPGWFLGRRPMASAYRVSKLGLTTPQRLAAQPTRPIPSATPGVSSNEQPMWPMVQKSIGVCLRVEQFKDSTYLPQVYFFRKTYLLCPIRSGDDPFIKLMVENQLRRSGLLPQAQDRSGWLRSAQAERLFGTPSASSHRRWMKSPS